MKSRRSVTIVRWSGHGSLSRLRSGVSGILTAANVKGSVSVLGESVLVSGAEPVSVASIVRWLPGTRWTAVGMACGSLDELSNSALILARKYLRKGDRFLVTAEATRGLAISDVSGVVVSTVLGGIDGTRVDDQKPKIKLRAAFDGREGAVGVELADGPGGVPTGTELATCLVSGGAHSSVLCWMALLEGYRVRMIHAVVDEASLREVARLYSELSNRVDPRALSLEVLRGGDPAAILLGKLKKVKAHVFAGFHSECSEIPSELKGVVEAPLFLMPEEYYQREISGLSLKGYIATQSWDSRVAGAYEAAHFDGARADVNEVLGGLHGRLPRRS